MANFLCFPVKNICFPQFYTIYKIDKLGIEIRLAFVYNVLIAVSDTHLQAEEALPPRKEK